ncbi:SDR family oxidoreductase [Sinimarinibacterium sp. CAU 1509]|uniref:SDR family NAD(P)-dependent oxidoreductase n=1 Tax=Sinimarinibacterium sp. CAU 1509 TaxID=2562283 RepID=UPI0010AD2535|nr:SDR family oxidoreductase [Sinimarinibacterium sp. CAU 1509]TJY55544.1 SDR family oxidoreductase [Sinimarinibacterium sp. CAU 1509]
MRRLEGRVVAVLGAASGIGAATARRLAEEGAAVVIGDVNLQGAQAVAASIAEQGGRCSALACDIADEDAVRAFMHAVAEAHGGLDGLHVNAADMRALQSDTDALDVPLEIFDRTLAVNLRGHLLCTRHALPLMLPRGGGAIVYTSSGAADFGEGTRLSYAVSKSGLHALMRHVATRWGKEGIRANAIAPGLVITEQLRDHFPEEAREATLALTRSRRLGEPEDIAAMVAMLMSDDGAWITGQVIGVDGGAMLR